MNQPDDSSLRSRLASSAIYPWLVFATVATGTFMVNVDGSILNIALPVLQQEFGVGLARLQWVVSGYLLVITAILPAMGGLSDRFGRRNFYISGLVFFSLGSLLCALATSLDQLIGFRLVQALGGAMMMGNGMSIIIGVFPTGQRGRALGTIGSVVAVGALAGPPLGGVLIDQFGWSAIFWINVPIGLIAIALGWLLLPVGGGTGRDTRFDSLGAFLFFVGMSSLLLFLSNGHLWGWLSAYSVVSLMVALLAGVLFIRQELRVAAPLIDPALFRRLSFSLGLTAAYLSFVILSFPALLLPLYLTRVLDMPLPETGWIMSAQALAMMLSAPVGGLIADRYGYSKPAAAGMGLIFLSLLWMASFGLHTHYFQVLGSLVLFGLGLGLFSSPNNTAVLESAPAEKAGLTGSLLATVRNFGRVSGVVFAVLLFGDAATSTLAPASFARHTGLVLGFAAALSLVALLLSLRRMRIRRAPSHKGMPVDTIEPESPPPGRIR